MYPPPSCVRFSSNAQGGPILKLASATGVAEIINAIQVFSDTTASSKWLVQPAVGLFSDAPTEYADEVRECLFLHRNLPHFRCRSLKSSYGALGSLMTLTS